MECPSKELPWRINKNEITMYSTTWHSPPAHDVSFNKFPPLFQVLQRVLQASVEGNLPFPPQRNRQPSSHNTLNPRPFIYFYSLTPLFPSHPLHYKLTSKRPTNLQNPPRTLRPNRPLYRRHTRRSGFHGQETPFRPRL